MPKIIDAWVDAASHDKQPGMGIELIVYLDNNGSISVCLDSKADAPLFSEILRDSRCTEVKTDGERVCWPNGASLTVDEMVVMLQEKTDPNDTGRRNI